MAQKEISCGSYRLTRKDNNGHKCIEVETKRKLTSGEKQMARTMFQGSINYDLVFICRGGIFHDVTGNARTLGNEITLPSKSYDNYPDFSNNSVSQTKKNWFIHEMAHIWQYQLSYNTLLAGACIFARGDYFGEDAQHNGKAVNKPMAYNFHIVKDNKNFPNFNMEQQAEIIAHYYDISIRKTRSDYYQYRDDYYKILKAFFSDPFNRDLLPTGVTI
ncbi:hypothetical protein [Psychrobacter vallis]|uniref:hypothetical protein n=1 Tax=Psychrobacter vallis TaxID=248451 RepID=UPI001918AB9E|nr:hypothetical protein [Psychrobacter vallis]